MPNTAEPLTFSGMSRRGSDLPISVKFFGSFSVTSFGTGRAAALSTSAPYLRRRPLALWTTSPFSVVSVFSGTLHVCAAAVTSIARAVAPALRRIFHMPRTLLLPAVSCWPPKFGLPYFASAGVHSVLIFVQSMSSSSATSIGIEVITPWPISSCVSMMRTVSSLFTLSQIFGSNEPAASSAPAFGPNATGR